MAASPDTKKQNNEPATEPMSLEEQRKRLRQLIALGKERGYLTYAEINDHLPEDVSDAEQIENIVTMIGGLGIQVYDEAPDAETLLMSDATPAVADEDAVEEAEAALSSVDSEFGRTTDPVRMYMREMGSVELLTREGEIVIAKRIEEGLKFMIQALSACPGSVAEVLALISRVEAGELRIDEVIDGMIDPEADTAVAVEFAEPVEVDAELADEDEEEDEEDEAVDEAAVSEANLEELKQEALAHFAQVREQYDALLKALEKHGFASKQYNEAQAAITELFMGVRFSTRQIESLCESLRSSVNGIRKLEREILDICVTPRTHGSPVLREKLPRQRMQAGMG